MSTLHDRQQVITVARLPGSLPMGGVVPDTPIFAFHTPPSWLNFSSKPFELTPKRESVDCNDALVFIIRNVTLPEEADQLIKASELFGFREEAPGISTPPGMRLNKSVHWIAPESVLQSIFERIKTLLPQSIDGRNLTPRLSCRLNVYKYEQGDVFNRHIDGDWPGYGLSLDGSEMVQWEDTHSCLSMLLYLNGRDDGVQGGSTRIFGRQGSVVDVEPCKGDALFFRHGFSPSSVMHAGQPVRGTTPKYLARINVLFDV
jgi:hypothetical protein